MWKITNIWNRILSFYADDGEYSKGVKIMSGIKEIGNDVRRYHIVEPGKSVISVSRPADEPRFKIEFIDEKDLKEIKTKRGNLNGTARNMV